MVEEIKDLLNQIEDIKSRMNKIEHKFQTILKNEQIDTPLNYNDYYFKEKEKKIDLLNKMLIHSGIILEFLAHKIFQEKGYSSKEYYYINDEKKSRQLDIIATKRKEFQYRETKIIFELYILADCKFHFNLDLLCFPIKEKEKFIHLPIRINNDLIPDIDQLNIFKSIKITNKIIQLQMGKWKKGNLHLNDKETWDGCKQVYDAVKILKKDCRTDLLKLINRLDKNHHSYLIGDFHRQFEIKYNYISEKEAFRSFAREVLKSNEYNLLEGVDFLKIQCIVPILIFDRDRGILSARLSDEFEIKELIDEEYCLLNFNKNYQLYDYDVLGEDQIFLTNLNGLRTILDELDKYLNGYETYFNDLLNRFPILAVCDFHEIMSEEK